jgi:hypothetical protein
LVYTSIRLKRKLVRLDDMDVRVPEVLLVEAETLANQAEIWVPCMLGNSQVCAGFGHSHAEQ